MSQDSAIAELSGELLTLLEAAEEELGRPLDEGETESLTEALLAGLDEDDPTANAGDNCGIAAGGFQKGNKCAAGDGAGKGKKEKVREEREAAEAAREAVKGKKEKVAEEHAAKNDAPIDAEQRARVAARKEARRTGKKVSEEQAGAVGGLVDKLGNTVKKVSNSLSMRRAVYATTRSLLGEKAAYLVGLVLMAGAPTGPTENAAAADEEIDDDVIDAILDFLEKASEVTGEDAPDVDADEVRAALKKQLAQRGKEKTTMNRNETVSWLVANCDCWKGKDEVLANDEAFSDEDLGKLRDDCQTGKKQAAALTAVQNVLGMDLVTNAETMPPEQMSAAMLARCKAMLADEEKKEPAEMTGNAKPPTVNEWLQTAPPEVQSLVRNAMAIEQQERVALVERITANLEGATKQALVGRLQGKPVDELRDLALLAPQTSRQPPASSYPSYLGAAGPALNAKDDSDNLLPVLSLNFDDMASPALRRKA